MQPVVVQSEVHTTLPPVPQQNSLHMDFSDPSPMSFLLTSNEDGKWQMFCRKSTISGAVGLAIFEEIVEHGRSAAEKYLRSFNGEGEHDGVMGQESIPHTGKIVGVGFGFFVGRELFITGAQESVERFDAFAHLRSHEGQKYRLPQDLLSVCAETAGIQVHVFN
jgi:hypothetical protein